MQRGHADQDVGERAIPALGQGFLGDHELHRAGRVANAPLVVRLDALQPPFLAGGDDDGLGGNAVVVDEFSPDPRGVQRLDAGAARFSLNQHDGAQVGRAGAAFLVGQLVQGVAAADGVGEALLPVRLGFQHHRQLDHFLGFQFGGGHAVQHVRRRALQIGRGGQFHHPTGAQAGQHVERQFGAAVVGFVHDHEGPAQPQHVGERVGGGSIRALVVPEQLGALGRREVLEVVHQRAAGLVDLAAFLVFHLKRLASGDNDRGRGIQRGAGDALGLFQVQHRDRAGLAQGSVVGMLPVLERLEGLFADRLARREPEDDAVFAAQQVGVDSLNTFGRQPGFAAASGHPQAEVGHVGREAR